jgi:hypothetical protein
MEHSEAFRAQVGLVADEVKSIGANRRRLWSRRVALDRKEVGRREEMEPVDNLRTDVRMKARCPMRAPSGRVVSFR